MLHAGTLSPQSLLQGIDHLPPLPRVVHAVLKLQADARQPEIELAHLLALDPGLSAQVLRLANSPFYRQQRQIASVMDALRVLGLRTVSRLVMAAGMAAQLPSSPQLGWQPERFWRHALGSAISAEAWARMLHMNADVAYTAGLLHDIGQLALAHLSPDSMQAVLSHQRLHDCPAIEAEHSVLGIDHAQLGARLAEQWLFPPNVVEAIACHHQPGLHHGPGLVGITHLADALSHALGLSGDPDEAVPPTPPDVWAALAPRQDDCVRLCAEVARQFDLQQAALPA